MSVLTRFRTFLANITKSPSAAGRVLLLLTAAAIFVQLPGAGRLAYAAFASVPQNNPNTTTEGAASALHNENRQQRTPFMIAGTVAADPVLEEAVRDALQRQLATTDQVESDHYAITDITVHGDWTFVSVIGLVGLGVDLQWNLTQNGNWFGLFLMTKDGRLGWSGALKGTPEFSDYLSQIPASILSEEAKQGLDQGSRRSSPAESYRFPWAAGSSMRYGDNGIHITAFQNSADWKAVDLLSDGDTSAGHAPNKVLAAAAGTVGYKCTPAPGQRSTVVEIGELRYVHLLDSPTIFPGKQYAKGDEIGAMLPGSFNENCGYSNVSPGWFHLHWAFPNTGSFQADGWTLSFTDQKWRKGSEVKGIGSWLEAGDSALPTSTPNPSPTSTPNPSPTSISTAPAPPACQELLQNGDFELQTVWTIPGTAYSAAYDAGHVYSGSWSARTGIDEPGTNVHSYSSLHQFITIPSAAKEVTLRFWLLQKTTEPSSLTLPADPLGMMGSEAANSGDAQIVLILGEDGKELDRLIMTRRDEADWQPYEFNLTHHAAKRIKLYFGTYNNGSSGITSMYIDNVSLTDCQDRQPAATPTATFKVPGDHQFYLPGLY